MPRLLPALALSASLLTACSETSQPVGKDGWLKGSAKEKFGAIANQLRGNDVAMPEIGYRFQELYWAGLDGNWEHAKYQIGKIRLAMDLARQRRPNREKSYQVFYRTGLAPLETIIAARDGAAFPSGMAAFTQSCNACHASENLAFFHVALPVNRTSILRWPPPPAPGN